MTLEKIVVYGIYALLIMIPAIGFALYAIYFVLYALYLAIEKEGGQK